MNSRLAGTTQSFKGTSFPHLHQLRLSLSLFSLLVLTKPVRRDHREIRSSQARHQEEIQKASAHPSYSFGEGKALFSRSISKNRPPGGKGDDRNVLSLSLFFPTPT